MDAEKPDIEAGGTGAKSQAPVPPAPPAKEWEQALNRLGDLLLSVQKEITDLRQRMAKAESALGSSAGSGDIHELSERLSRLESKIETFMPSLPAISIAKEKAALQDSAGFDSRKTSPEPPAAAQPKLTAELPAPASAPNPENFQPAPAQGGIHLSILSADDDPEIRALLYALFTSQGHDIEFAKDGEEALQWLGKAKKKYDLLILDVAMPRMNGYQVAEVVCRCPRDSRPKVLLFTARQVNTERPQFVLSGADAILSKTDSVDDILQKVHELTNN